MSRRHLSRAKRRRARRFQALSSPPPRVEPSSGTPAPAAPRIEPDDVAPADGDRDDPPIDLDRLMPALPAGAPIAGLAEPPTLIVEPPERVAARMARDQRDGVKPADRRGMLYVGIALFVAALVFAVLGLIESGAITSSP